MIQFSTKNPDTLIMRIISRLSLKKSLQVYSSKNLVVILVGCKNFHSDYKSRCYVPLND